VGDPGARIAVFTWEGGRRAQLGIPRGGAFCSVLCAASLDRSHGSPASEPRPCARNRSRPPLSVDNFPPAHASVGAAAPAYDARANFQWFARRTRRRVGRAACCTPPALRNENNELIGMARLSRRGWARRHRTRIPSGCDRSHVRRRPLAPPAASRVAQQRWSKSPAVSIRQRSSRSRNAGARMSCVGPWTLVASPQRDILDAGDTRKAAWLSPLGGGVLGCRSKRESFSVHAWTRKRLIREYKEARRPMGRVFACTTKRATSRSWAVATELPGRLNRERRAQLKTQRARQQKRFKKTGTNSENLPFEFENPRHAHARLDETDLRSRRTT